MAKIATATTTSAITYTNVVAYKTAAGKFAIAIVGSVGNIEVACDSKEELLNLIRTLEQNAASL